MILPYYLRQIARAQAVSERAWAVGDGAILVLRWLDSSEKIDHQLFGTDILSAWPLRLMVISQPRTGSFSAAVT